MKLSHVTFKVDNLAESVAEWEEKGFCVEYGQEENAKNALIYFKEGAYVELLHLKPLPTWMKIFCSITGKKHFAEKINNWAKEPAGLLSITLENDKNDLDNEEEILKKHNLKGNKFLKKRVDSQGRNLNNLLLFTHDLAFPNLMTYFTEDPKPLENMHSNGITGIESISVGISEKYMELFKELCDDPCCKPFEGSGIEDLTWKKGP